MVNFPSQNRIAIAVIGKPHEASHAVSASASWITARHCSGLLPYRQFQFLCYNEGSRRRQRQRNFGLNSQRRRGVGLGFETFSVNPKPIWFRSRKWIISHGSFYSMESRFRG